MSRKFRVLLGRKELNSCLNILPDAILSVDPNGALSPVKKVDVDETEICWFSAPDSSPNILEAQAVKRPVAKPTRGKQNLNMRNGAR